MAAIVGFTLGYALMTEMTGKNWKPFGYATEAELTADSSAETPVDRVLAEGTPIHEHIFEGVFFVCSYADGHYKAEIRHQDRSWLEQNSMDIADIERRMSEYVDDPNCVDEFVPMNPDTLEPIRGEAWKADKPEAGSPSATGTVILPNTFEDLVDAIERQSRQRGTNA